IVPRVLAGLAPLAAEKVYFVDIFFFSSRRRHTRSVSAFLLNRSSDLFSFPQLDINNTIDHRPEGDEKWFLENEKTVTQFCRKLRSEERRVGKECRYRWGADKKKKNEKKNGVEFRDDRKPYQSCGAVIA